MADRLDRLRAELAARGLDAVAVVPGANLRYTLGLDMHMNERLTVALVTADGRAAMVLPRLELPRAEAQARVPLRFYPWDDDEGPQGALRACVTDLELEGRLGVEFTAMRVLELRGIEAVAPLDLRTEDAGGVFAALRVRKDVEELESMGRAVQIIEESLRAAIARIRVGMTERELADVWDHEMAARGGSPSFTTTIGAGPNAANPHHSNSDRPFQPGDLIIMDGGAWSGGYASDITRTVAVGEPPPEARRIYELVEQANAAGRAAAALPGASGDSIDRAAREVIVAGGYGPQFFHRTGHGLGMEVHEPPYIVAGAVEPLPVGATFTVEPGIYVAGACGVRIEDDMVITPTGAESLTSFERGLIVVDA